MGFKVLPLAFRFENLVFRHCKGAIIATNVEQAALLLHSDESTDEYDDEVRIARLLDVALPPPHSLDEYGTEYERPRAAASISLPGSSIFITRCTFIENKQALLLFHSEVLVTECDFVRNYDTAFGSSIVYTNSENQLGITITRSNFMYAVARCCDTRSSAQHRTHLTV